MKLGKTFQYLTYIIWSSNVCHRAPPGSVALLLRTPQDTWLPFSGLQPRASPTLDGVAPNGMAAGSATPQSQLRHLLQQTFPPLPGAIRAHRAPNLLLLLLFLPQLSPTQPAPSAHQHHCGHSTGTSNSSSASPLGQGGTYLPHQCLWGLHLCPPSNLVAKALHTMHSQKKLSGML